MKEESVFRLPAAFWASARKRSLLVVILPGNRLVRAVRGGDRRAAALLNKSIKNPKEAKRKFHPSEVTHFRSYLCFESWRVTHLVTPLI